MPDTRYHFFYVIVIFLFLGFGILAGSSFYGPEQVRAQQKYLNALREEANRVVQERDEARSRRDKDEDALQQLWPSLVAGKLAGKRVVLIQTGDYAEGMQDAAETLTRAGASVAATLVLTDRWASLTADSRAASLASLAHLLTAGAAATPANQEALDSLQSQGLVTLLTGDVTQSCTLFVLVGGGKGDPADGGDGAAGALDTEVPEQIATASGQNARVVGCETDTASVSSVPAYQQAGIATVDCIDLPLGRLALPFALRGEAGDYGVKPTASRVLPGSLEAQHGP